MSAAETATVKEHTALLPAGTVKGEVPPSHVSVAGVLSAVIARSVYSTAVCASPFEKLAVYVIVAPCRKYLMPPPTHTFDKQVSTAVLLWKRQTPQRN